MNQTQIIKKPNLRIQSRMIIGFYENTSGIKIDLEALKISLNNSLLVNTSLKIQEYIIVEEGENIAFFLYFFNKIRENGEYIEQIFIYKDMVPKVYSFSDLYKIKKTDYLDCAEIFIEILNVKRAGNNYLMSYTIEQHFLDVDAICRGIAVDTQLDFLKQHEEIFLSKGVIFYNFFEIYSEENIFYMFLSYLKISPKRIKIPLKLKIFKNLFVTFKKEFSTLQIVPNYKDYCKIINKKVISKKEK